MREVRLVLGALAIVIAGIVIPLAVWAALAH